MGMIFLLYHYFAGFLFEIKTHSRDFGGFLSDLRRHIFSY